MRKIMRLGLFFAIIYWSLNMSFLAHAMGIVNQQDELIITTDSTYGFVSPTHSKTFIINKLIMEDNSSLVIEPSVIEWPPGSDKTPYEVVILIESAKIGMNCKIVIDSKGTELNANKALILLGQNSEVKFLTISAKGLEGQPGKPGSVGRKGADATVLDKAGRGHPGGKGEPGQPGGNGANVYFYYMPGAKIGIVKCENLGGDGGKGGPGGPGGPGGDGIVIYYGLGKYVAHDPGPQGNDGPQGDNGLPGNKGDFVIEMIASHDGQSFDNENQKKVLIDFGIIQN